jgi:hypothetical protein
MNKPKYHVNLSSRNAIAGLLGYPGEKLKAEELLIKTKKVRVIVAPPCSGKTQLTNFVRQTNFIDVDDMLTNVKLAAKISGWDVIHSLNQIEDAVVNSWDRFESHGATSVAYTDPLKFFYGKVLINYILDTLNDVLSYTKFEVFYVSTRSPIIGAFIKKFLSSEYSCEMFAVSYSSTTTFLNRWELEQNSRHKRNRKIATRELIRGNGKYNNLIKLCDNLYCRTFGLGEDEYVSDVYNVIIGAHSDLASALTKQDLNEKCSFEE